MISTFDTTLEQVAEVTHSTFEEKIYDKSLVIIYPRHHSQNTFISFFLQTYGESVIYYSLEPDDRTVVDFLHNIANSPSLPDRFGGQTRAALDERAQPEDLAAAFGADLSDLRADGFILILDRFDHLEMDEAADQFFLELPHHMAAHTQIVINARLLDLQPWNDLIHAGHAAVIGDEEAMGGSIYGDDPALGQLEVYALSGGRVYIDGRPVTSWDGSLPRHLFYYFVDHPMVTRDQIFDVFWPKMSVKEATNVFHVTKRKISERLGHELTKYSGGFYVHSPRLNIHYDAHLFDAAVEKAIDSEGAQPAFWYQAVQLYRDEYLPYISMPWVEERRQGLQHGYAQALIGLGRFYRGLGQLDDALGYFLRAVREKPDWEDIHQDVMMIYSQQGRIEEARQQYHMLKATLHEMFKIKPSKDTERLYETITMV